MAMRCLYHQEGQERLNLHTKQHPPLVSQLLFYHTTIHTTDNYTVPIILVFIPSAFIHTKCSVFSDHSAPAHRRRSTREMKNLFLSTHIKARAYEEVA